jgi:hypothetical protein
MAHVVMNVASVTGIDALPKDGYGVTVYLLSPHFISHHDQHISKTNGAVRLSGKTLEKRTSHSN